MAGAEVETKQREEVVFWETVLFQNVLYFICSFQSRSVCAWQISRSGRIIPEREFRLNAIRRDHQRHARECLADAICHKVLDIEVCPR